MALKIQLINKVFGSMVIGKNDPIGINDITQAIKRSEQYEGVVYEIVLDIAFIKEGKGFITNCYNFAGGIDAKVIVQIYDYNPNTYFWELYYNGQVNYQRYDKGEVDVVVTLEQAGKDRAVLNMMEIDVDAQTTVSEGGLTLPEQDTFISLWHSKVIPKDYEARPQNGEEFQQLDAASFSFPAVFPAADYTIGAIWYGTFDAEDKVHEELEDTFTTGPGFLGYSNPLAYDQLGGAASVADYIDALTNGVPNSDPVDRFPLYDGTEEGVISIILDVVGKARIVATNVSGTGDVDLVDGTSGVLGHCEVHAWCEHRNAADDILFIEHIGEWDMATGESGMESKHYEKLDLSVAVGDKVYWYLTYRVYGTYEGPAFPSAAGVVTHDLYYQADKQLTTFQIKGLTKTPPSNVRAIMIYECFQRCLQFYTNEVVCFYSELLGRTDLGYAVDGDASLIAINNGHWIRGRYDWENNLTHKKLFLNLDFLIRFVNAQQCVGFGFETVNINGELVGTGDTGLPYGTKVFRLEKREHFYRRELVVSLGRVYGLRERLDPKRYYNLFEYGSTGKLDTKLHNAIDEFNTIRQGRIPIVNTKNQLKIATDMRISGYQIELERRLATSKEDSNHDDEIFATSMVRESGSFRPKRDDGYAEINNVVLPETGYNYDFSPGRARKNWLKVIASCLIRHTGDKKLYFSSGQTNYRMTTRKTTEVDLVKEDGDEDLSGIEPYYDPTIYDMENVKFTREQIKLIQSNPYAIIEVEDLEGLKYGFLDSNVGVDHDPFKRQAKFNLLKAHNFSV